MKQMMSEVIYKDLKKIVSVGKDGEKRESLYEEMQSLWKSIQTGLSWAQ